MVFQIDFVLRYLDTGIGNHSDGIRQKVQDMAQNLYIDTRGCADRPVAFTEAVVDGLAQGGGLYVPERIPSLSLEDILALADLPYAQRAARIYRAFDIDLPDEVRWTPSWRKPMGRTSTTSASAPSRRSTRRPTCWSCGTAPPARSRTWPCNACHGSFPRARRHCASAASLITSSSSWWPLRATRARPHWKDSRTPKGCASACCSPTAA